LAAPTLKEATQDTRAKLNEYETYRTSFESQRCGTIGGIGPPITISIDGEIIVELQHPDSLYSDFRDFVFDAEGDSITFTVTEDSVRMSDGKRRAVLHKTVDMERILGSEPYLPLPHHRVLWLLHHHGSQALRELTWGSIEDWLEANPR
jgi:hypothetical protein